MKKNFTLVEMLAVVAIIAILAGLAMPAIGAARKKARILQARSDMNALKTGLLGMDSTYGKILDNSGPTPFGAGRGTVDNTTYVYTSSQLKINGVNTPSSNSMFRVAQNSSHNPVYTNDDWTAYKNLILSMSIPQQATYLGINTRKLKFLDPRSNFSADSGKEKTIWHDPWGNPYVIIINTNGADAIKLNGEVRHGKVFIYSFGDDKVEDSSKATNTQTSGDVNSWDQV